MLIIDRLKKWSFYNEDIQNQGQYAWLKQKAEQRLHRTLSRHWNLRRWWWSPILAMCLLKRRISGWNDCSVCKIYKLRKGCFHPEWRDCPGTEDSGDWGQPGRNRCRAWWTARDDSDRLAFDERFLIVENDRRQRSREPMRPYHESTEQRTHSLDTNPNRTDFEHEYRGLASTSYSSCWSTTRRCSAEHRQPWTDMSCICVISLGEE